MSIRVILVPVAPGIEPRPKLDAASSIGRIAATHIRMVFVSPDPGEVLASLSGVAMAIDATMKQLKSEAAKAASDARAVYDAWCRDNGILDRSSPGAGPGSGTASTSASFATRLGSVETLLAAEARLSDLIVLERPDGPIRFTSHAFDAALFASGRASLVIPPRPSVVDPLDHVLIAWNDSVESTSAVAQALPVLKAARRVSVFAGLKQSRSFDGLQEYLGWHEIPAVQVPDEAVDGKSSGERILAAAKTEGAGMIVMGAYTHSRARQFFLGGATQHLLSHGTVPLLMAH